MNVAYVPLFLLRFPLSLPSSSLRRCLAGHVRLPLLWLRTAELDDPTVLASYPRMDLEEALLGLRALWCTTADGMDPAFRGSTLRETAGASSDATSPGSSTSTYGHGLHGRALEWCGTSVGGDPRTDQAPFVQDTGDDPRTVQASFVHEMGGDPKTDHASFVRGTVRSEPKLQFPLPRLITKFLMDYRVKVLCVLINCRVQQV